MNNAKDDADKPAQDKILDLDTLPFSSKVVIRSDVFENAAKQAAETSRRLNELITVGSSFSNQLAETGRIASNLTLQIDTGMQTAIASLAKAQLALVPPPSSLIFPALESINKAQMSQLAQVANSVSKITVAWKPIFDLRVISASWASELLEANKKVMESLRFDIGTMVTPLQVLQGLSVGFQDTQARVVSSNTVSVKTTSVRTFDNELVSQRQETKIDMLLSSTSEQTGIIANFDKRLSGIETMVFELTKQGKELFTIKDFAYNKDTCELLIKKVNKRVQIRARRERQLCELLLSNAASMVKQWSVDDLLDVIGETFTQMGFDTQGWTDKFYKAALRLNAKLKPMLGFDLILVDRKQETFYINPQFYHN